MTRLAKFCTLFSGSTGNSTYIGGYTGGILVDAGASCKAILTALDEKGVAAEKIAAVCITHEHDDHIKGLSPLLKKLNIPLIASAQTLCALEHKGKIPAGTTVLDIGNEETVVGDIAIRRFATSHDCAGSSGYLFFLPDNRKISVCTDTGVVTDEIRQNIKGSDLCLIESNHDLKMLKNGPYPPELKLRVMSDKGHLSNNACAAELPELLRRGTTRFILGHLSRNNNLPALALSCAKNAFADMGARQDVDYILKAAPVEKGEMIIL